MNSIILSSVVTALLVFSGCSTKDPAVDTQNTNSAATEEVKAVQTETITGESSSVDSSTNSLSMSDIESKIDSVYFSFDKFDLNSKMKNKISDAAKVSNGSASAYKIKLEGNCDEWGSDEYNFALGLRRSNSVKKALVAEGVSASRISMVSYGESNPACADKTQACWSKNRRVDFKLLP